MYLNDCDSRQLNAYFMVTGCPFVFCRSQMPFVFNEDDS